MLPSVTADDFRIFLDGTGKPFTQFLDSVVRANAAKLSISPADVHTNIRVNVPDGGVDTQVDSGNDPEGRLLGPTLWQYKARRFADMDEAAVREEIHGSSKEYARELIRKGYAYRLCICEDTSSPIKLALQTKLNEFVREVYQSAPPALLLLPSDLAEWANHFPAVIAKLKRLPVDKFRFFESWKPSATAETPVFIPTEHFADLRPRVEAHIDWGLKPREVALTVFGDAGVGKSRSVFEVLNVQVNQQELTLYTSDEQSAIAIATALANDDNLNAILIADECLSRARFQLAERLRGTEKRIRLITIDNAKERTRTMEPELQVRTTEAETLAVLDANFENVPPDRRRRYATIAKGFPRFAIYMCSRDSEITQSGSLSSALGDAQSYYEHLFSDRLGYDGIDREAVEIVALLDRVGYREDRTNELDTLCVLVGRNVQQIRERIEKVRTRTGLISSAGRFYYVTPTLIAMIAFNSAWARWIAPDPQRFLKAIPEDMIEAFQNRVSGASPEVGALVAKFFRDWTITRGAELFESESDTRRLVALVVADPKGQVPLLRSLVESASPSQLGGGEENRLGFPWGSTSRRLLVSLAEELAQFSDLFVDAESILFRLAMNETEPSIGNNATKTWTGLFRILLSGTEVPFQQRYEILRKHFAASDPAERTQAILAAAASVDQRPYRIVGSPLFGSRVPPRDWRPGTAEEYSHSVRDCVDLIRDGLLDPEVEVSNTAKKMFIDALSHLLWAGLVGPLRESLEEKLPPDIRPRVAALVRDAASRPGISVETRTALESWMKALESQTLHERLVENIAAEPWSHHFEETQWRKRLSDLAQELFADQAFEAESDWLNSGEAKGAAELGHLFGRLDNVTLHFLDKVFHAAIEHNSDAFARGYVYGATEFPPSDTKRLNEALDRMQAANPRLAYYVMLPAGDSVRSFDRAMSMVSAGLIPARLLSNLQVWVGNRKTTPDEARAAVRLLLPFVQSGREAGETAIDFIAYQINRVNDDEQTKLLVQMFGESLDELWTVMEAVVTNPGREAFWFVRVLQAAAPLNPIHACRIASRMLASDDYQFSQQGQGVIAELAQHFPEEVMEVVGEQMTQSEQKQKFLFRKFPVLASLPFDVVVSWLKRVGVEGARAIARHLEPPNLNSGQPWIPPLTEFVLTYFENDDRTFSEFVAGVHSFQLYAGSYSSAREQEAFVAKAFIGSPIRRVREWAQLELTQAEGDARVHRIREEEFGMS